MDKNRAVSIIEDTFDRSFNKEQFILFAQNLLNDLDKSGAHEYRGNLIKEAFREHISQYWRVGKYTDPNGIALDVLIIEVKNETKLDKARTSLRNFVIHHLTTFEKEYALAAFYSKTDNGRNWRFSFIKLEHQTLVKEGKIKQQKELTPARRYSFLVGEDEKCHTAKRQLLPLLQNVYNNPLVEDLEKAFSIEVVTDEFFEQYKGLFLELSEVFGNNAALREVLEASGLDIPRFTKKLLGQIVFLYFLQKKGWLGVPAQGNWGSGEKNFLQRLYEKAEDEGKNFFKDYLQYLFYEALARQHGEDNYYKRFDCRIPFLNGGLFEADYDWINAEIILPDSLFRNQEKVKKTGDIGTGVLDVFDRYNFTIREDEPLEKEVAVDPEMLGKVFENMLEITERKSKGAFYTPREIVHYMCQESLIHYLDNAVNAASDIPLIPKEEMEEFVHKGILTIENDTHVLEKEKETDTYKYRLSANIRKNADLLDRLITNIKICDPAIGSGAFPVGLLNELVTLQLVLKSHLSENYLQEKLTVIGLEQSEYQNSPEKYVYRIKRHNIQESIYGVDIDASAIDIARLRLWLSLVVDEENFDNIEALPNLDYKIVCGNSLIGMPTDIVRDLEKEKELEELKEQFFSEKDEKHKKELRLIINKKIREFLDFVETFAGYKIDFDFKLYFSEVWREKKGFDIVIGNPPYGLLNKKQNQNTSITVNLEALEYFKNSDEYNPAKGGVINIFRLFIVKSSKLLGTNKNGIFAEIFPLAFTGDITSKELRKYIINNYKIIGIEAFPERDNENTRVFKHAKMSVCILFFSYLKNLSSESPFYLRIFSTKNISDSFYSKTELDKNTITSLDEINYTVPVLKKEDLNVLLNSYYRSVRLKDIGYCYTGEIDMTLDRRYIRQIAGYSILLKGAILDRFLIRTKMSQGEIEYLDEKLYLEENQSPRSLHHQNYRIGMQGITGVNERIRLKMTLIPPGVFLANSVNYIILNHSNLDRIKSVLLILNSDLLNYIFSLNSTNSNVNGYEVNNLPIKENIPIEITSQLCDYMLFLAKQAITNKVNYFFYELFNSVVFELYFPDEIHSAGKGIIEHLHDLRPIDDTMSDEEKLAVINSEFERLYDPYHPVRNHVDTLENVEVVKIIKESLRK